MKKIKEVVELSGLSRRTLQYYDDMGLMNNLRTSENYRIYGEEDLQRLWTILLLKEMGFPLEEIREFLNSDSQNKQTLLKSRAASVTKEVADLKRILTFLEEMLESGLPDFHQDALSQEDEDVTMVNLAGKVARRL